MSTLLSKQQCLKWIENPTINPLTGKLIQINKGVFKNLLSSCQSQLTLEEVNQTNPEMVKVLFPSGGQSKIPIKPKWYESDDFKHLLSLEDFGFKKYKDAGISVNIDPLGGNLLLIQHDGIVVTKIERGENIDETIKNLNVYLPKILATIEKESVKINLEKLVSHPSLQKYKDMGFSFNIKLHSPSAPNAVDMLQIVYKGKTLVQSVHHENGFDTILSDLIENLNSELEDDSTTIAGETDIEPSAQPSNENVQLSKDAVAKNTFKIPKNVNFSISKLTEKNKAILAKKAIKTLISEKELTDKISDDDFITKLLISERKLLEYKLIQYTKSINQTETALNDPLLKIPASPPQGGEPAEDIASLLKKKLQSLQENASILKERHQTLKNITPVLISEKRKKINIILDHPENGIRTLIGESREEIKQTLYTQIISFSKAPELYVNRFNNYTLMGGAGAGKTKLAGVLGNFFYNLGILNSNRVIIVTRADLVGKYVGQTGPKTRKYLESTLEGVLFIDEAYQLSGCPDQKGNFSTQDFGSESITEIVNYVDKNIGLSVIIAAGYEDKITGCFLKVNEGMKRRFSNNLRLLDYTSQDLADILFYAIKKLFDSQILTDSQRKYIVKVITKLNAGVGPDGNRLFSNQAGDMLNLSSVLVQDLVLNQKTGYQQVNINDTFTKFFMNKGYQIIIKHVSK